MKTGQHPPYSPYVAPSNFCLFGYIKGRLTGGSLVNAEELFEAIRGVRDGIKKVILQRMFLEWMDRIRKCIQTNDEYTE
jgi:hypothetical protein